MEKQHGTLAPPRDLLTRVKIMAADQPMALPMSACGECTIDLNPCHVMVYAFSLISACADQRTLDLYTTGRAKRLPPDVAKRAAHKHEDIDLAATLEDLGMPPGNRPHALAGDRKGHYAIAMNNQWRICLRYLDGAALEVEGTDDPS